MTYDDNSRLTTHDWSNHTSLYSQFAVFSRLVLDGPGRNRAGIDGGGLDYRD
jgi:hypothetical protein